MLRRARDVACEEGLHTLWFKVLGETVYRRVVVLTRGLDEPYVGASSRLPIEMGRLDPSQADDYVRFRPGIAVGEVVRRLRAGQRCDVARIEGRLVCAAWSTTDRAWINCLDREIAFEPDTVCVCESYAAPEVRGANVLGTVAAVRARDLRAGGYGHLMAVVVPENVRSRRAFAKLGYAGAGRLGTVRLGPWRHDFFRSKHR